MAAAGALAGCASATAPAAPRTAPAPPAQTATLPQPDPLLRQLIGFRVRYRDLLRTHTESVRTIRVTYRAYDGTSRAAYVVLPRWYGRASHPPIPLVISPHGRGVPPQKNMRFWGGLAAFGPFAVVNPEGQGRRLMLFSWGWRGQIDDLARMPAILEHAIPWLRIDHRRVYAVGSSMGGQETLLLAALHPRLLTGAAALDSATNMAARYPTFLWIPGGGRWLQVLAQVEIGGTPALVPGAYGVRSPINYVRQIAFGGVPLHIWWSTRDRIVVDQRQESGRLYRAIKRMNPAAPVAQYVGTWAHSKEMHALARLPLVLVELKLIELDERLPRDVKP